MIIDEELIFSGLECKNSEEVMKFMADNLEKNGYVKNSFYDGLLDREANFPTGLDFGDYSVAMPHTEVEHVIKSTLSIATLKDEIGFKCAEDHNKETKVKVVCMIAFGEKEDKIDVLTKLIDFFGNKDEFLKMTSSNDESLKKIVKEKLEGNEVK